MRNARLLVLVPLLAVAACNGSGFTQPKVAAFHQGSCRELAPPVLALGKDLHLLGTKRPGDSARDALKHHQGDLRTHQAGLSADLGPVVQDLVTKVGLLRLRTDSNSYDKTLATDAMDAYLGVVKACTT